MGILRVLLALSVIASHTTPILGFQMLPGQVAVKAFFIVSGFYMAMVLAERYPDTSRGTLLFYSNRFLRLYPTYLVTMLAMWVVFLATWAMLGRLPGNSWIDHYATMSFLQKAWMILTNWGLIGTDLPAAFYYSSQEGFVFRFPDDPPRKIVGNSIWAPDLLTIPQAWSVGLEIWFYLLAPWLARARGAVLVGVGLASFATMAYIDNVLQRSSYFFFPAEMWFFVLGIFAYRALRIEFWQAATPWFRRGTLALVWAFVLLYPSSDEMWLRVIFYIVIVLALPLVFMQSRRSRIDREIGELSYPIYIVHLFVPGLLMAITEKFVPPMKEWLDLLGTGNMYAVSSMAAAILLVRYVEKPIEALRERRVAAARGVLVPAGSHTTGTRQPST